MAASRFAIQRMLRARSWTISARAGCSGGRDCEARTARWRSCCGLVAHGCRQQAPNARSVSDSAVPVGSPAVGAAGRGQPTRVVMAGADVGKTQPAGNGRGLQTYLRRAIAQFAVLARAPAVGCAVNGDTAGVATPAADLVEPEVSGDGRRREPPLRAAVADLAAAVQAPAVSRVLRRYAARGVKARAHLQE